MLVKIEPRNAWQNKTYIKHGKIIQVKVKMKFINQSYEQAYTKSSNDNTCKTS